MNDFKPLQLPTGSFVRIDTEKVRFRPNTNQRRMLERVRGHRVVIEVATRLGIQNLRHFRLYANKMDAEKKADAIRAAGVVNLAYWYWVPEENPDFTIPELQAVTPDCILEMDAR